MNNVNTILFQDKTKLRHYEVNGNHYVFDNLNMRLSKLDGSPKNFSGTKFISRDLVDLSEAKIQKRATYVGYNAIIELTDKCNLRCVYCYRQDHLKENVLDKQSAKGIIKHLIEIDRKNNLGGEIMRIIFFGGEPLLNFKILQFIVLELSRLILNYQLKFSVSTNGVLLTQDKIDFFEKYRFSVQVSFEGDEESQGNSRPFANGKNSFNVVQKNLDLIKQQKKGYSIAFSLSKLTSNIADKIDEQVQLGFINFNLLFIVDDIIGTNCLTFDDIDFIKHEIEAIVDKYIDYFRDGKIITIHPLFDSLTYLHTRIPKGVCNATVNVEAFGTNGDIYPCQRFLSIPEYKYGNVLSDMNEDIVFKIRDNKCYFASECSDCWMKAFCSGKCAFLRTIPRTSPKGNIGCIIQSIIWDAIIEGYIKLKEDYSDSLDYFYECKTSN